jgi:hypothetical protein
MSPACRFKSSGYLCTYQVDLKGKCFATGVPSLIDLNQYSDPDIV